MFLRESKFTYTTFVKIDQSDCAIGGLVNLLENPIDKIPTQTCFYVIHVVFTYSTAQQFEVRKFEVRKYEVRKFEVRKCANLKCLSRKWTNSKCVSLKCSRP